MSLTIEIKKINMNRLFANGLLSNATAFILKCLL